MRISDWSSDVCSSDLLAVEHTCSSDHLGPCTNANDDAALGRLLAYPLQGLWIIIAAHCRNNHVIRPIGVAFIKLRNRCLRLHLQRREQGDRPRLGRQRANIRHVGRSEEHTSELQSLMRISYAVFCLKKNTHKQIKQITISTIPT